MEHDNGARARPHLPLPCPCILRKVVVALSGIMMTGWAFLHMAGTLGVFAGAETMNGYAELLRRVAPLSAMRLGLLLLLLAHAAVAVSLVVRSNKARAQRNARYRPQRATWFGRRMSLSGGLVFAWLAYHIAHMYGPASPNYVAGDVHHNLVTGLASPLASASYVLAAILFGLHLNHGAQSALTTLGTPRRVTRRCRPLLTGLVFVISVGFLAPPIAALLGYWN